MNGLLLSFGAVASLAAASWLQDHGSLSRGASFQDVRTYYTKRGDTTFSVCRAHDIPGRSRGWVKFVSLARPGWHTGVCYLCVAESKKGSRSATKVIPVIFRQFKDDGDLIAIFPNEPADNRGNVSSYQHVGQHGAADPKLASSSETRPAPEGQALYALRRELAEIGYDRLVEVRTLAEARQVEGRPLSAVESYRMDAIAANAGARRISGPLGSRSQNVPFYERTLDSFSDEVITRTLPPSKDPHSVWYAVLDVGPSRDVGDPDFATGAKTRTEAVARAAKIIRDDARGIGKYAPHAILTGYDLKWRLMKHWADKEMKRG